MKNPDLDSYDGLEERFRSLIRRLKTVHANRPEVVGQIMPRTIRTVAESTHIAELVPLMADSGFRHVPIVDASRQLSGIISQSDLIAALYLGRLEPSALSGAKAA